MTIRNVANSIVDCSKQDTTNEIKRDNADECTAVAEARKALKDNG